MDDSEDTGAVAGLSALDDWLAGGELTAEPSPAGARTGRRRGRL